MSGVRFFEQAHIKDVCTLLRLAANPADSLAFSRMVEMLPKVGPKKAQSLWRALGEHANLRDAAKRAKLLELLPKEAQPLWQAAMEGVFADDETGAVLDRPDESILRFTEHFYADYAEDTFDNARQNWIKAGKRSAWYLRCWRLPNMFGSAKGLKKARGSLPPSQTQFPC